MDRLSRPCRSVSTFLTFALLSATPPARRTMRTRRVHHPLRREMGSRARSPCAVLFATS
jgi:hypothetical protein